VLLDGQPIGSIGVTIKYGAGEIGNMILGDKTYARSGYMRQGVLLLMRAFGLNYWWLHVLPDNIACMKFYEKLGFTVESAPGDEYSDVSGETRRYKRMSRTGVADYTMLLGGAL
jgi:RimJ/RimL family protein N-acetyltransferase